MGMIVLLLLGSRYGSCSCGASAFMSLLSLACYRISRDDYVLTILDPHPVRPQACVDADPDNVLCQLTGGYTVNLNNYATKDMYAHMAEKCPSLPPKYDKPANC